MGGIMAFMKAMGSVCGHFMSRYCAHGDRMVSWTASCFDNRRHALNGQGGYQKPKQQLFNKTIHEFGLGRDFYTLPSLFIYYGPSHRGKVNPLWEGVRGSFSYEKLILKNVEGISKRYESFSVSASPWYRSLFGFNWSERLSKLS